MSFWQWLKQSSKNPEQLSLSLKSFVPLVIALVPLFGIELNEGDFINFVEQVVAILASVGLIVGLVRKVYLSNTGKFGAFWK